MNAKDLLSKSMNRVMTYVSTSNGRNRSWEYCYEAFSHARKESKPDIDHLALSLGFFLASWGLYRGSSFLLQRDYTIHKAAVEMVLDSKYDCLWESGNNCASLLEKGPSSALEALSNGLRDHYGRIREDVKCHGSAQRNINAKSKSEVSNTLITKILLGTLGCVPAYDSRFVSGVVGNGVTTGTFNIKSVHKLVEFYQSGYAVFEKARSKLTISGSLPYPQMKLLDMCFWCLGSK